MVDSDPRLQSDFPINTRVSLPGAVRPRTSASKSASKTGKTLELSDAYLELISSGASTRVKISAHELGN